MTKRLLSFFLAFLILPFCSISAFAHDRDEHDADIEYILFGDAEYKNTHPLYSSKIKAIEDAGGKAEVL